jgi:hypothetical protein
MKTIALLAVLFAGSAFAQEYISATDDAIARANRMVDAREAQYQRSMNAVKIETPRVSDDAVYGKGQEYTIVTLPDGKTASALTFK